ncbi:MAG: tetratricopeptide repeat protein [Micropepsaceae bacterium]
MNQLQQALKFLQSGDAQSASRLLSRILAFSPEQPDALQLMGALYRQTGELIKAADFYRRSVRALPAQPHTLLNLGNILVTLGQDDEARDCYQRALLLQPSLSDAHYNLGLLLSRQKHWTEAVKSLAEAARLQPENGRPHEALGIAYRELGEHDASVRHARLGARLQPRSLTAHHNLGQAHMGTGDFEAAADAYDKALAINPSTVVTWIGLGHAYRGMGRSTDSRDAYKRAVELDPSNSDAHRLLNEMVWQTGDVPHYLQSFRDTLTSRADDPRLRLTYANELLKILQHEEAAKELERVLKSVPSSGDALDAMARAKSGIGDFDAACGFHAMAFDQSPADNDIIRHYSETLLKAAQHQRAHGITTIGLTRFPIEQGILALHTTAQRLVGDEGHFRLADYGAIPKVKQLEPPPGYADIESFCADLKIFLEGLHTTKSHPTDQTLRGGTQTFGALFQNKTEILQQFVVQLRKAIAAYISEMPEDLSHPLFQRARRDFDFSGSWSVRLSSGGFHTNHFHPMGWISSAFYVNVPEVVSVNGRHDGWFKMGETNLELGDREVIHRYIQPKVGHLALFPSYFWHGTVPFESSSPRITIAFDVVPK